MIAYKIDVTKEHCPMTFVKTKLALAKLTVGETLEVRVNEGEPLENIPRSSQEQGFKVLSITESNIKGQYLILIEK
jgi:TusA-related sulfurtransferase